MVREGEVLAGKFVVERVLGQGGMGVVVAARHMGLDERVAVKFLLPEVLAEGEAVARFVREARAAVRIKSEHVARVTDVGQLESGAPYMVMEYLEGSDLAGVIRAQHPLPVSDVVDYVLQACEAIAEAHALGIVHRDLKPANLMLVRRSDGSPCIKVLDFGISKMTSTPAALAMTKTTSVFGSPLYMSPEQMMSTRDVDERTDIWSLGVILYELLTGALPFVAPTQAALGVLIATREPDSLRDHRGEVPVPLERVVLRCLMKRRDERFHNVAALAQALAPFAPPRSAVSIERVSKILASSAALPSNVEGGAAVSRSRPAPVARAQETSGLRRTALALTSTESAPEGRKRRDRRAAIVGAIALVSIASLGAALTIHRFLPSPEASVAAARSFPADPPPPPSPAASVNDLAPPPAWPAVTPALAPTAIPPRTESMAGGAADPPRSRSSPAAKSSAALRSAPGPTLSGVRGVDAGKSAGPRAPASATARSSYEDL
jgi:serine/threonine-protein kinase